jgi:nucleoside 2-deoxyribosyltransferase
MRRDFRGRESQSVREIVELDMDDINKCDAVLAHISQPSAGTSMEIFYAKYVLGKPVVVVNATGRPSTPWVSYFSDSVVDTIEDAIRFLEAVKGA